MRAKTMHNEIKYIYIYIYQYMKRRCFRKCSMKGIRAYNTAIAFNGADNPFYLSTFITIICFQI